VFFEKLGVVIYNRASRTSPFFDKNGRGLMGRGIFPLSWSPLGRGELRCDKVCTANFVWLVLGKRRVVNRTEQWVFTEYGVGDPIAQRGVGGGSGKMPQWEDSQGGTSAMSVTPSVGQVVNPNHMWKETSGRSLFRSVSSLGVGNK